jgi:DNA-directed RNA polymerase specialized sigma24 family protein
MTINNQSINPILDRIITEEKQVKAIIYNTMACRMINQSTFLSVDDVYQDICMLAMDTEKITKRANKLTSHFYGSIKMFTIDCILKEQRRIFSTRGKNVSLEIRKYNKQAEHKTGSANNNNATWITIKNILNASDLKVFTMYTEGYTLAEIAQSVGQASVQYTIQRIIKKLQIELAEAL